MQAEASAGSGIKISKWWPQSCSWIGLQSRDSGCHLEFFDHLFPQTLWSEGKHPNNSAQICDFLDCGPCEQNKGELSSVLFVFLSVKIIYFHKAGGETIFIKLISA